MLTSLRKQSINISLLLIFSYDLEMMCDCDDEYWENEDPTLAFIQPPGLPSRMSFFNHWTKLMEIEGLAHSVLVSFSALSCNNKY